MLCAIVNKIDAKHLSCDERLSGLVTSIKRSIAKSNRTSALMDLARIATEAAGIKYGAVESTSVCTDLLKQLDKALEGYTQDISAVTYGRRISKIVCPFSLPDTCNSLFVQ